MSRTCTSDKSYEEESFDVVHVKLFSVTVQTEAEKPFVWAEMIRQVQVYQQKNNKIFR